MPLPASTPFVFMTCAPGAERLLKADLAARSPSLRFAFSRPGFLTFKLEDELPHPPSLHRPSPFARSWGAGLGPVPDDVPLQTVLAPLREGPDAPQRIHAFCRDHHPFGEVPPGEPTPWERDQALVERLAAELSCDEETLNHPSAPGERVLDIIEVDEGKLWLGFHEHGPHHAGTPAERPPQWTPPEQSPSRVWFKITEAMWRTGVTLDATHHVLDIGCAPGGGTRAMLDAGARVLGIDPAQMDEEILAHPSFSFMRRPFEGVAPAELPEDLTWFVYDVNLSPMMMLKHLRKLLSELKNLKGGFVTLKLNREAHLEQLGWMVRQLEIAGFLPVTPPRQLFANRQELFLHVERPT